MPCLHAVATVHLVLSLLMLVCAFLVHNLLLRLSAALLSIAAVSILMFIKPSRKNLLLSMLLIGLGFALWCVGMHTTILGLINHNLLTLTGTESILVGVRIFYVVLSVCTLLFALVVLALTYRARQNCDKPSIDTTPFNRV
eukprot:NODE_6361_length_543_cov_27.242788_g6196_i0.p1 GENE.NODE_6361_length_543_cov_27.242788_g6196_i0~~NODE_6361_length_543_cov_27.242788_g6196_i0.p1  ORF type:complete len:156 (+),score=40.63 NODE_6361_length_543_cov_27.242788_g6196_i0:47-469(+)